ncbi:hypothetical protein CSC94_05815 [Zhengella mangrovi]|uniref:HTH cro/C1-type domain-containing protein n=1 Tax=Zhengella mangrovi TaxID=1982044 RepID=A0A2G1QRK7_9HYPH|nr:helix-turn-helix transcriptional regulator [Zhengella mangrovi]PHP68166.1 hypothetical protein CSC94_05815 [Zhengella mangrovi]
MDNLSDDGFKNMISKDEFGRRVYRAMIAKGWRQSELARQSRLTRDSISQYVRGKSFPTRYSLDCLARALEVPAHELIPDPQLPASAQADGTFEYRLLPDTNTAFVKLSMKLPAASALKIAQIVADANCREKP